MTQVQDLAVINQMVIIHRILLQFEWQENSGISKHILKKTNVTKWVNYLWGKITLEQKMLASMVVNDMKDC